MTKANHGIKTMYALAIFVAAAAISLSAAKAANAETCTWVGEASAQMSSPANWTVTSGGSCQLGSGSTLTLNNNRNANWDIAGEIGRVEVQSGYTGTLRIAGNALISGALKQANGIIDISNGHLRIGEYFQYYGGSFLTQNSTVNYSSASSSSMMIAPLRYDRLILGSGVYNLTGVTNVTSSFLNAGAFHTGDFTISSHALFQNNGILNESGAGYIKHVIGEANFTRADESHVDSYVVGSSAVYVRIIDADANVNGSIPDTITSTISASATGDTEIISLRETGNSTGIFRSQTGLSLTSSTPVAANNGRLEAGLSGTLTLTYADTEDPTDRRTDTASYTSPVAPAPCSAPVVPDGALYVNGVRWGGATASRNVTLSISGVTGASQMMISESPNFAGGAWEFFVTPRAWTLSSGNGEKRLYAKFRSACGEARATTVSWITLSESLPVTCPAPVVGGDSLVINGGARYASSPTVTLTLNVSGASEMMLSENLNFAGASWEPYAGSRTWTFSSASPGLKLLYARFRNSCGAQSSTVIGAAVILGTPSIVAPCDYPSVGATPVSINNGAATANSKLVTVSLSANGADYIKISNSYDLSDAVWKPYRSSLEWILPPLPGPRSVYVQFAASCGSETAVYSDSITIPNSLFPPPKIVPPSGASTNGTPSAGITSGANQTSSNTASMIRFSGITATEPQEDAIEDDELDEEDDLNFLTFSYVFRNGSSRPVNVRIVRQVILNNGGAGRVLRSRTARVWLRGRGTYKTKKITEALAAGNYTVRVQVRNSRTNALIDQNSFTVNLGGGSTNGSVPAGWDMSNPSA